MLADSEATAALVHAIFVTEAAETLRIPVAFLVVLRRIAALVLSDGVAGHTAAARLVAIAMLPIGNAGSSLRL